MDGKFTIQDVEVVGLCRGGTIREAKGRNDIVTNLLSLTEIEEEGITKSSIASSISRTKSLPAE